ncbi:MAG: hypothetical protein LBS73_02530 [Campylobacteraceae bacterium]|jgi:hydrogenase maturation factor HypF (carbamoyltransferase family)|nr:hypothetical protein [Campylobacteraceae bacterium]
MILVYEFTYVSQNAVLENFLDNIAKSADVESYISKKDDKVLLHVKGDEEQLGLFSEKLSKELPYSLFLNSTNAYIDEAWDTNQAIRVPPCDIYLPFTKQALDTAVRDFNPFVQNEIGENQQIYLPLIFEQDGVRHKYSEDFAEAFERAADIVAKGQKLNIKTLSGIFCVSQIEDKAYDDEFVVMPSELSIVSKIAVTKNEEISTLVSLEKPIVRAHTNMIFASKYPNFPRFLRLAMADDLFLYFLSLALFKKGVEFVILEQKENLASAFLYFEQGITPRPRLEVCALQSGQNIITHGTWHMKPQSLKNIKFLKHHYHTQFAATMQESGVFDKANCGIYLSLKHNDKIMFYNDKVGVLDILSIEFKNSFKEIFLRLASDESGEKLVANYKQAFPHIYQKIENISFEGVAQSVSNLWGIAAILMGFGDDLRLAREKLLENIEMFAGEKGPRIDYKLIDENSAKQSLDAYKLLKSVMSFRLAGADDGMLSYGIGESLVYFLSDFADKLKGDFEVENIFFMGSLFGTKSISNLCVKHLSVNHKVHFSKELPIEL